VKYTNLYWNDWKYIGSGKPTCRLCSHYFGYFDEQKRGVNVRNRHHNLYMPWRLPDLPPSAAESGVDYADQQQQLEKYVTERVRENIRRTLVDRRTKGKRYDSNSYTLTVRGPHGNGSSSAASTTTHDSLGPTPPPPYDGRPVAGEVEYSED
jgi:hypothetical protein